jgi:hypothetical protein
MNPQITIIATGDNLDRQRIESVLGAIPELTLQLEGPERGYLTGAVKAVKWVAEYLGKSGKVADLLIQQATKELAGASIKIQFDGKVIEVNNLNRSQIIEVLDRAAAITQKQNSL